MIKITFKKQPVAGLHWYYRISVCEYLTYPTKMILYWLEFTFRSSYESKKWLYHDIPKKIFKPTIIGKFSIWGKYPSEHFKNHIWFSPLIIGKFHPQ